MILFALGALQYSQNVQRMAHLWKIASIGKDAIDREKESHLPREKEYWVRV